MVWRAAFGRRQANVAILERCHSPRLARVSRRWWSPRKTSSTAGEAPGERNFDAAIEGDDVVARPGGLQATRSLKVRQP